MSHVAAVAAIPARLAQAARTSSNVAEARARVLRHYRDWYRAVCALSILHRLHTDVLLFLPSTIGSKIYSNSHVSMNIIYVT
jgi:hypothetical protein